MLKSLSECSPRFGGQHGLILGLCKNVQKMAKPVNLYTYPGRRSMIIQKILARQCLFNFGYKKAVYFFKEYW